jgi:hypothetical protein
MCGLQHVPLFRSVRERQAIALFRLHVFPGSGREINSLFQDAMEWYRKAQTIRPAAWSPFGIKYVRLNRPLITS